MNVTHRNKKAVKQRTFIKMYPNLAAERSDAESEKLLNNQNAQKDVMPGKRLRNY